MCLTVSASVFVDDELPVFDVVAERRQAAHPHALLLGGRDLVADALAGDLALELGKRQQDVERQAPHRRRGVELLGDRHKGDAMLVENVDDLGEVGQRPGQPVNLVDDHHVDLARAHIRQEPLEGRPFHRRARETAVVIHLADKAPSFAFLAGDERLAGFALGVERVEVLFQPLLAALAGIDRATKFCRGTIGAGRRSISHWPASFAVCDPAASELQLAIRCTLADQAEETGSGPMGPGDGVRDLGQGWKDFAGVFESVFRHDHGVRPAAPLPHQSRARPKGQIGRDDDTPLELQFLAHLGTAQKSRRIHNHQGGPVPELRLGVPKCPLGV